MKTLAIASLFLALAAPIHAQAPPDPPIGASVIFADDFAERDTSPGILGEPLSRDNLGWFAYLPNRGQPATFPRIYQGQLWGMVPNNQNPYTITFYMTPSIDGKSITPFAQPYVGARATVLFHPASGSTWSGAVLLSSASAGIVGVASSNAVFVHDIVTPTVGSLSLWEGATSINNGLASCTKLSGTGRLKKGGQGYPTYLYYAAPLAWEHDYQIQLMRTDIDKIQAFFPDGSLVECQDSRIATDWGQTMVIEEYTHNDFPSYGTYRSITAYGYRK